jgi:hypothetical protein
LQEGIYIIRIKSSEGFDLELLLLNVERSYLHR